MKTYSRQRWGARKPAAQMSTQRPPLEAFVHWTVSPNAERLTNFNKQAEAMRAIQRLHQDTNGWADVGYHFVVFQPYGFLRRARAFVGRPDIYVPAAQANHNNRTLAISVYAAPGDKLKRNTRYIIEQLIKQYPSIKTVGGHRDVTPTQCPGDEIYSWLGQIARATGRKRYAKS